MTNNYVDENGLHVETLQEIIDSLEESFQTIYGSDVNLEPNSPDAQMIAIFAQAKVDTLDALSQVYSSFNPDTAVGSALDQRCAINGVIRRGATYTRTYVTVTASSPVTIYGLDTQPTNPFTVADTTGNKFDLENTTTLSVGSNVLTFRAKESGLVATTIGTITTIVTITLGVSSVSNASSAIITGAEEETDSELRLRRQASVSLPSQGFLEGLTGSIKAIDDVSDAIVYENTTDTTDGNGVPPHSIWAIIDGGTDEDIADVIYQKRNAGCGMKGDETVYITQVNGTTFPVLFDRPLYDDLYISLTVTSIDPAHTIDDEYLKAQIYEGIVYTIYQPADFTAITTLVKQLDPLAVVTAGGVSDHAGDYEGFLYPGTIQTRWLISTTNISITVV